jgi:hypothetical protein
MKRFFAIIVVLMIILMSLGCATVPETSAPRTESTGLVSTVGSKPFIGDSSRGTLDLNGWNPAGGR